MQLEDDNGGIILNISESGLAMHTVRSLTADVLPGMRFQFSRSQNWIEARGRIAWISASKKMAGVAFVDLPDEARNQIRDWILKVPPSGWPEENTPGDRTEDKATAFDVENPRRHSIAREPVVILGDAQTASPLRTLFSENMGGDAEVRDHGRPTALVVIFVLALGAVIGLLSLRYRVEISALLNHFRPQSTAVVTPQAAISSPPSISPAGNALNSHEAGQGTETAMVTGSAKSDSEGSSEPRSTEVNSQGDYKGESELALARKYLRESGTPNGPKAIQLLWLAIEKGNRKAELQLADLYLRGEAVPRNCEQARILLRAADNGSDPTVALRMHELAENGCK